MGQGRPDCGPIFIGLPRLRHGWRKGKEASGVGRVAPHTGLRNYSGTTSRAGGGRVQNLACEGRVRRRPADQDPLVDAVRHLAP